jgi:hypothetical protein
MESHPCGELGVFVHKKGGDEGDGEMFRRGGGGEVREKVKITQKKWRAMKLRATKTQSTCRRSAKGLRRVRAEQARRGR